MSALSAAELDAIEAFDELFCSGRISAGAAMLSRIEKRMRPLRDAMARASLRQDDGRCAGMLRAADIVDEKKRNCSPDDIAAAIRAEAGSVAPQPDAGPEPVAWQWQADDGTWQHQLEADEKQAQYMRDSFNGNEVRALYAAPPALVPDGEVTEEMVEAGAAAICDRRGFGFYTDPMEGGQHAYDISCDARDDAREALRAAFAARKDKPLGAPAGKTEGRDG